LTCGGCEVPRIGQGDGLGRLQIAEEVAIGVRVDVTRGRCVEIFDGAAA